MLFKRILIEQCNLRISGFHMWERYFGLRMLGNYVVTSDGKDWGLRPESHSHMIGFCALTFWPCAKPRVADSILGNFEPPPPYVDTFSKVHFFKNNLSKPLESKIPQFLPRIFVYKTDLIRFDLLQSIKVCIHTSN